MWPVDPYVNAELTVGLLDGSTSINNGPNLELITG